MTVTAIQIGLDPDMIDYSSSDFVQFPGLSKEGLRGADDDNVAALRAAGFLDPATRPSRRVADRAGQPARCPGGALAARR